MSPLQWTPQHLQETWNSLGTAERIALAALGRNVITLHAGRVELAKRQPPLVNDKLDELTPRGRQLVDWAIETGRLIK